MQKQDDNILLLLDCGSLLAIRSTEGMEDTSVDTAVGKTVLGSPTVGTSTDTQVLLEPELEVGFRSGSFHFN
jgi:hypothetical protein